MTRRTPRSLTNPLDRLFDRNPRLRGELEASAQRIAAAHKEREREDALRDQLQLRLGLVELRLRRQDAMAAGDETRASRLAKAIERAAAYLVPLEDLTNAIDGDTIQVVD